MTTLGKRPRPSREGGGPARKRRRKRKHRSKSSRDDPIRSVVDFLTSQPDSIDDFHCLFHLMDEEEVRVDLSRMENASLRNLLERLFKSWHLSKSSAGFKKKRSHHSHRRPESLCRWFRDLVLSSFQRDIGSSPPRQLVFPDSPPLPHSREQQQAPLRVDSTPPAPSVGPRLPRDHRRGLTQAEQSKAIAKLNSGRSTSLLEMHRKKTSSSSSVGISLTKKPVYDFHALMEEKKRLRKSEFQETPEERAAMLEKGYVTFRGFHEGGVSGQSSSEVADTYKQRLQSNFRSSDT